MIYTYIAVAAVAGLLIGFVTLSVIWAVRTVSGNIRRRSVSLLSTYDGILDRYSRELKGMEAERLRREQAEEAQRSQPLQTAAAEQSHQGMPATEILRTAERIGTTEYRHAGASDLYRRIREGFAFTPEEVLYCLPDCRGRQAGGPAARTLELLAYDTVFQLSTLPGQTQVELLAETLPEEGCALLREYADATAQFDSVAFVDFLRARAAAETGPIRVWTNESAPAQYWPEGVCPAVDPEICEGFQIEADNVLYDYCIKAREIS